MAIRRRKEMKAFIPTASMADIAFLLIIFFMVTTRFDVDRTRVDLPDSNYREEIDKGAAVVVIKEEAGDMLFKFSNGEDMSAPVPDQAALAAQINALGAKPVVIKAGGEVQYRYIDETMEMLRRAGIDKMILLTEQETIDAQ
jgi:biopolymer transport protein ExbD